MGYKKTVHKIFLSGLGFVSALFFSFSLHAVSLQAFEAHVVNVTATFVDCQEGYSLSGVKFNDQDRNRVQDEGEEGLSGWVIVLTKGPLEPEFDYDDSGYISMADKFFLQDIVDGTAACPEGKQCDFNNDGELNSADVAEFGAYVTARDLGSRSTAADGSYSFGSLTAGSYVVYEVPQDGWTNSTPAIQYIDLQCGENTVDFGNFRESTAECGNGIVEENEECDLGAFNSDELGSFCTTECRRPQACDGQIVLDFDTDSSGADIEAGQFIDDEYKAWGVSFDVRLHNSEAPAGLITFDSSNPTGGDIDLGTPNLMFGGPGNSQTGDGTEPSNHTALGNLLIIPENIVDENGDGLVDDPDDNRDGGTMIFLFDRLYDFAYLHIIDLDHDNADIKGFADAGGEDEVFSMTVLQAGGNSVVTAADPQRRGIRRLEVHIRDSFAVDNLTLCPIFECGDGFVDNGEECDDGNIADGDGCSSECRIEQTQTGEENNGSSEEADGEVVLNEILPNPIEADNQEGLDGEWVELYNLSSQPIDVKNWKIVDRAGNTIVISSANTHTASTLIGANGSGSEWLVVFMNGAVLNNDGDTVMLVDSSGTIRDTYQYKSAKDRDPEDDPEATPGEENKLDGDIEDEGKSHARIPDGTGEWVDPIPTPGGPNKLAPSEEDALSDSHVDSSENDRDTGGVDALEQNGSENADNSENTVGDFSAEEEESTQEEDSENVSTDDGGGTIDESHTSADVPESDFFQQDADADSSEEEISEEEISSEPSGERDEKGSIESEEDENGNQEDTQENESGELSLEESSEEEGISLNEGDDRETGVIQQEIADEETKEEDVEEIKGEESEEKESVSEGDELSERNTSSNDTADRQSDEENDIENTDTVGVSEGGNNEENEVSEKNHGDEQGGENLEKESTPLDQGAEGEIQNDVNSPDGGFNDSESEIVPSEEGRDKTNEENDNEEFF